MTKTEARAYFTRIRADLRDAERALLANDGEALLEAVMDIGGCAGTIESDLQPMTSTDEPVGVGGITAETR